MQEKTIHKIFDIGLTVKGLYAIVEFLAGVFMFAVSPEKLGHWVISIAQKELAEDHGDAMARLILHSAQQLQSSSQLFIALYLIAHALIKLILIAGLLKKILWVYPVAMVIFAAFGVYQVERWIHTHSQLLVWLTVLDAIVIWLTWHEYRYYQRRLKNHPI